MAMMMTGKIIVGLLATAVFFSFFPAVGALIAGFEDIFFITADKIPNEALFDTLGHLSPVGAYVMSLADISDGKTVAAAQILGLLIAIFAGGILGMELYRKRPMEAAGRAMAFKKTMAPIVSSLFLQLVWGLPCSSGHCRAVCTGDCLEW